VQFAELSPHYQLVVARERTLDSLEVRVEAAPSAAASLGVGNGGSGAGPAVAELRRRIADRLRGVLGIAAHVTVAAPGSLPRSEGGKLRRVIDERPRT
jgi:phenylacetate-CoA ligase